MHFNLRGKMLAGVTVVAVGASAGGAYAATQSGASSRQSYLNDVAKQLNVTPAQLTGAMDKASTDQLNADVAAGRLTQAQANSIEQRIKDGDGGPFFGGGFGGGHFGGLRGDGADSAAVASYLGITQTQLSTDQQSGKSLAQVAAAQGKSVSGLEAAITSSVKSNLDKAVADKSITQAREQQILSDLSSRVASIVNGTRPAGAPDGAWSGPGGPGGSDGATSGSGAGV